MLDTYLISWANYIHYDYNIFNQNREVSGAPYLAGNAWPCVDGMM
jgi:hypothetical protein